MRPLYNVFTIFFLTARVMVAPCKEVLVVELARLHKPAVLLYHG